MKMEQNQKGITLVALIFTIVILFILATVSIKSIIDGRIFSKTKSAKELYSQAEEEEMIRIAANNAKIDGNSKIQTKYLTSTLNEQFEDDWEFVYEKSLDLIFGYKANKKDRIYLAQNGKKLYGGLSSGGGSDSDSGMNNTKTESDDYWIIKIKSSERFYKIFINADVNLLKDATDLSEIDKVVMAAYEAKNGGDKVNEELLETALNKYFKDDWEWAEDSSSEDVSDNKEKNIFNNIKLCNTKESKVYLGQKIKKYAVRTTIISWTIQIKSTGSKYTINQNGIVEKKLNLLV